MGDTVISSGFTSTGPVANNDETITVLAGGLAISALVGTPGSGIENVYGSSTDAIIHSGGHETILPVGADSFTTVGSGGSMVDEGTATSDTILARGAANIVGTAIDLTVSKSDSGVFVDSGGVVSDGIVEGYIDINGGGSAVNMFVAAGGSDNVIGATTGALVSGTEILYFGGTTTDTSVGSGGFESISSGGVASATTVGSGGTQYVYSGGAASGTIVSSGGFEYVSSGGVASATTVDSGGAQYVYSGGAASGTIVSSGGNQYVYSGGAAVNALVQSGGQEVIQPGGSDSSATVMGEQQVSGTATGDIYLNGGGANVFGTATDFTLMSTADFIAVQAGGVVSGGIVENIIDINSGASAVNMFVAPAGVDAVGGSTTGTILSGAEYVFSSATTTGTSIGSGGFEYVSSGGVASATIVYNSGEQYIYSGGSGSGTVVSSGGFEYVSSGGIAAGTTIESGGAQYVFSSGASIDATVSSGGVEYLFSASVVSGTTLAAGGAIDAESLAFVSGGSTSLDGNDDLTVIEGANSATISLAGDYSGETFQLSQDASGSGTDITAFELCFLRGTRILTPIGEVAIETIRIGDPVVTRFSGIQSVKWIGRQSYDARFVRSNPDKRPIRICAGALGDRLPARDLFVSPGHSVLLNGHLILAKLLVNGITITQVFGGQAEEPLPIEYFNIELEAHDCVIAEGAWAETFADGPGLRDQFHNAAEFFDLYPDQPPADEFSLCAPRPERGPKLEAALRPVVVRAATGRAPGRLQGHIDRVSAWKIDGWAFDPDHADLPVLLEVCLGSRVIGAALACDYRDDLAKARKGRGRCAFAFTSPERLKPETLRMLRVRRVGDAAEIKMTRDCLEEVGTLQRDATRREGDAPRVRLVA